MTKQCRANGITIGYEECGAGEPLVLLMGLGAPGSKWAPHMAAYEKYFHCYAMDNRGAGHSDKPVAYSYTIHEAFCQVLFGVIDAQSRRKRESAKRKGSALCVFSLRVRAAASS